MPDLFTIVGDLREEAEALDDVVSALDDAGWATPTSAEGWTVRDQIWHLVQGDDAVRIAVTSPDEFRAGTVEIAQDLERWLSGHIESGRERSGDDCLAGWREARAALTEAALTADPGVRYPWLGNELSLAAIVTTRVVETWAHGLDVTEALQVEPNVTDRVAHVCWLGARTRPFVSMARHLDGAEQPVRIELTLPSGALWADGPPGADNRVSGSAYDFARLATRRASLARTDLSVTGPVASAWLPHAQTFAGDPGADPTDRGA